MHKKMGIAFLAIAGMAIMSSCTKDPVDNLTQEESRIYITNKSESADFGSYKTFSISDSVYVIDNNNLVAREASNWDQRAINAVKNAMAQRGYVLVSPGQSPDLGINVSRIYSTTTSVVDFSDYYGGYGGYYDPYYWGYGGYGYYFPPVYGLVENTEAAMSIDILDLENAHANNAINGIWSGMIRGSGIFNSSTIDSQIQLLFDQSEYLQTTE
jgi:Domain of unknown function (DUF4136)